MNDKKTVKQGAKEPPKLNGQHLLSIEGLELSFVQEVLERAEYLLTSVVLPERIITAMPGKLVAPLFFEASTRTRHSF